MLGKSEIGLLSRINPGDDVNEFWLNNHMNFNSEDGSIRIKFHRLNDPEENIEFSTAFGYNEIGVGFSVETILNDKNVDRASIFVSSLSMFARARNQLLKRKYIKKISI